jgi:hypothetical protein
MHVKVSQVVSSLEMHRLKYFRIYHLHLCNILYRPAISYFPDRSTVPSTVKELNNGEADSGNGRIPRKMSLCSTQYGPGLNPGTVIASLLRRRPGSPHPDNDFCERRAAPSLTRCHDNAFRTELATLLQPATVCLSG